MVANMRKQTSPLATLSMETLLFTALNSINKFGICILSEQGNILYSNQNIADIIGYTPDFLYGKTISLLSVDSTNNFFSNIISEINIDNNFKIEDWIKCENNSFIYANMTFSKFLTENGLINYCLLFFDRTKEYENEIFLQETKNRYEYVTEGARTGIWDWNIQDNTSYCSSYFLEIFGIQKNEFFSINKALTQIHIKDREKFLAKMNAYQENFQQEYELEFRIIQSNSLIRYCLSRGRPVFDEKGNVIRVVSAIIDITPQKTAQTEIKYLHEQLEKRFSATFQQAAVGFAHVGLNSIWQKVNSKLCEIFGYPENELTKLTFQEITYFEDLAQDLENVESILSGEIPTYSLEKRFIRKDGTLIWATITVSLVRDEENNPEYFITVIEDISQRKNAEFKLQKTFQQLQENEARLNRIIHSNIAGIFFSTLDNVLFDANDNFLKMIGYTREDLLSGNITRKSITPEEFQESDVGILTELIQKGFANNYDKQYIRKDGKKIDVLVNHILLSENRTETVTFVLDITERKLAEQALLESEQRFRKMAHDAPIMLWMTDSKGYAIYANKYWLEYNGITLNEYIGQFRPASDSIHPEDRERTTAIFLNSLKKQKTYINNVRYKRADGEYRWLSFNGNPRFTYTGEFVGYVGICQDITDSKLARDKLKKLAKELEFRVNERTREIQTVNKELEAFSYSVSHDLRAPLRSIDGFSNIIANSYAHLLDEQGKEYFQFIRDNTQRMGYLIDDLLKLSRISRIELDFEKINLSEIAEEICKHIQLRAPERHVNFCIKPNIIANGDPHLLRIVLENLLDNAWKFTRKKSNAIIEFSSYKENGEIIYFVKDTGAGFDMKFVNKLFGAFQRLHSMDEFSGTGIGLATVQRIIHRHNGRAWAVGEPNNGAIFYFTLPQVNEIK
ncbi:MAG: Adaptive-response sensory-kinase SasA [Legionellaceae bacterium]